MIKFSHISIHSCESVNNSPVLLSCMNWSCHVLQLKLFDLLILVWTLTIRELLFDPKSCPCFPTCTELRNLLLYLDIWSVTNLIYSFLSFVKSCGLVNSITVSVSLYYAFISLSSLSAVGAFACINSFPASWIKKHPSKWDKKFFTAVFKLLPNTTQTLFLRSELLSRVTESFDHYTYGWLVSQFRIEFHRFNSLF